ncbi:ATP-dependent DNA ligase [Nitrospirota bacterium]
MIFHRLAEYLERIESASQDIEMIDILSDLFLEADASETAQIIYLSQGQLLPSFNNIEIGMSEKLLLRTISDTANKSTLEVEEVFRDNGDLGQTAEALLTDGEGLEVQTVYDDLANIANTSGKGSIEHKINQLRSLLIGVTRLSARFIVRFVNGKLRLGIGDPTVMEALGLSILKQQDSTINLIELYERSQKKKIDCSDEQWLKVNESKNQYKDLIKKRAALRGVIERAYNLCSDLGLIGSTLKKEGMDALRDFNIMVGSPVRMALCERLSKKDKDIVDKMRNVALKEAKKTDATIEDPYIIAVEAKYDGLRLQIHKNGEKVDIFSRNLERMTHMFPDIVEATGKLSAETLIIEGEAIAYNENTDELLPFQMTIKRKRKHNVDGMAADFPLKFFAFELLYINGEDYTVKPYSVRRETLVTLTKGGNQTIEPAEMKEISDPSEIDAIFTHSIERGLEGIIAKRLESPYAAGARNFNWIKLKRSYKGELSDTLDLCIVGYYFGKGARARFGVGAILAAVYDTASDTFKTVSKVGSGFTEDELSELRITLDPVTLKERHARVDSILEPDAWVTPRYIITVTADEITRSPSHTAGMVDGTGYALRFPRTVDFLRMDKKPEDATTVAEVIKLAEQN